jgi:hypothetical protein
MLSTFSGYSPSVIYQDIWTNLLFYNLQSITHLEAVLQAAQLSKQRKAKANKRRKKENNGYQVNRNIGAGILRKYWFDLWECEEEALENVLAEMQIYYLQSLEIVKPKKADRNRKMLRTNDRHHTELNYKRGF